MYKNALNLIKIYEKPYQLYEHVSNIYRIYEKHIKQYITFNEHVFKIYGLIKVYQRYVKSNENLSKHMHILHSKCIMKCPRRHICWGCASITTPFIARTDGRGDFFGPGPGPLGPGAPQEYKNI